MQREYAHKIATAACTLYKQYLQTQPLLQAPFRGENVSTAAEYLLQYEIAVGTDFILDEEYFPFPTTEEECADTAANAIANIVEMQQA